MDKNSLRQGSRHEQADEHYTMQQPGIYTRAFDLHTGHKHLPCFRIDSCMVEMDRREGNFIYIYIYIIIF